MSYIDYHHYTDLCDYILYERTAPQLVSRLHSSYFCIFHL